MTHEGGVERDVFPQVYPDVAALSRKRLWCLDFLAAIRYYNLAGTLRIGDTCAPGLLIALFGSRGYLRRDEVNGHAIDRLHLSRRDQGAVIRQQGHHYSRQT